MHLSPDVTTPVAAVPFTAAVLVIAVGVVRSLVDFRRSGAELAAALKLGLELFLAAGLIRLASGPDLRTLGIVATIIAVRRISGTGIRLAARASGRGEADGLRA